MYFSIKDSLRQAVEAASGGKNTVLYNQYGQPIVVVIVPMFRLQDIDDSWPSDPHPAFIVNDEVKKEIYIGKYQAVIENGRALSLPGRDPAVYVNFDTALNACAANGPGFHLMSNAEWAGIALWCWKNNLMPKGNNYAGTDVDEKTKFGRETYTWKRSTDWNGRAYGHDGTDYLLVGRVATGSGPPSWSHDGTPDGIYDLNGNVYEWVSGMRLDDGEIQIIPDNNAATNPDQSTGSTNWKAVLQNGNLVAPGTSSTLKVDGETATPSGIRINTAVANRTTDSTSLNKAFGSVGAASGVTVPDRLKHLALYPAGAGLGGDYMYARNNGERLAIRGGYWSYGAYAGVFYLDLYYVRSSSANSIGFRVAYA